MWLAAWRDHADKLPALILSFEKFSLPLVPGSSFQSVCSVIAYFGVVSLQLLTMFWLYNGT
jgi:hypothetical protein